MSNMEPSALHEQLAAAHLEIESLEQQLADSRDHERNTQRELDNAKRETRGLRRSDAARAASTRQAQQSPVDNDALKQEVEALRKENENLKARIQSLLTPRPSTHTPGSSILNQPRSPRDLSDPSAPGDKIGGLSFPGWPTARFSESSLHTPRSLPKGSFGAQSDIGAPQQLSVKKQHLPETQKVASPKASVADKNSTSVESLSKEVDRPQLPQTFNLNVQQELRRADAPVLKHPRPTASIHSPAMITTIETRINQKPQAKKTGTTKPFHRDVIPSPYRKYETDQRSFEEKEAELLAKKKVRPLFTPEPDTESDRAASPPAVSIKDDLTKNKLSKKAAAIRHNEEVERKLQEDLANVSDPKEKWRLVNAADALFEDYHLSDPEPPITTYNFPVVASYQQTPLETKKRPGAEPSNGQVSKRPKTDPDRKKAELLSPIQGQAAFALARYCFLQKAEKEASLLAEATAPGAT